MSIPFDVLAEPNRRRILDLLLDRPYLVGELTESLGLSQPGTSKHLRVLREAGLVRVRQDAQRRWYELRPEPLAELDAWLAQYRHLWSGALDALERHLDAMEDDPSMNTNQQSDTLTTAEGRTALRMERKLAHPPQKVWAALTEPASLARWFPAQVEVELEPGGTISFRFPGDSGPATTGVVTDVEEPWLFSYTWGDQHLSWAVAPYGEGSLLTLVHTFGDHFGAASFASGWHLCTAALAQLLDGGPCGQAPTPVNCTRGTSKRFDLDRGMVETCRAASGSASNASWCARRKRCGRCCPRASNRWRDARAPTGSPRGGSRRGPSPRYGRRTPLTYAWNRAAR